VLLFVAFLLPLAAVAEEIRIGGAGTGLGTMRLLGEAFVRLHPEHRVKVLPSIGSSGAIKAVPRGGVEIGIAARALTASEEALGMTAIEYARSPTGLAVSSRLNIGGISREQIVAILAGRLTLWPDGTPIRPVLRQPGDDSTHLLKSLAPGMERALAMAEQRPGLPFAATDQEAAEKIEAITGAIGMSSLSLIRSEGRGLQLLALDGMEPSVANAAAGRYPLVKCFFVISKTHPTPAVQRFIAFLETPAAREILLQTGHWRP
jgi:phosphate transport system substrate-binding protein